MSRVLLVRHAPTAHNAAGVFQGQADIPALPVEASASYQLTAWPRIVYCSPLQRARTAAALLFPDDPAVLDARLTERSVGDWEGLDHATVERGWPGTFRPDGTLSPDAAPPGGESLDDFAARVSGFLADLSDLTQDAYVVTHNGWIRVALWQRGLVARDDLFAEPVPFLTPIPLPAAQG